MNQYSYNLQKVQVITARCYLSAHSMIDEKKCLMIDFYPTWRLMLQPSGMKVFSSHEIDAGKIIWSLKDFLSS